jgi:hypothetical protein
LEAQVVALVHSWAVLVADLALVRDLVTANQRNVLQKNHVKNVEHFYHKMVAKEDFLVNSDPKVGSLALKMDLALRADSPVLKADSPVLKADSPVLKDSPMLASRQIVRLILVHLIILLMVKKLSVRMKAVVGKKKRDLR